MSPEAGGLSNERVRLGLLLAVLAALLAYLFLGRDGGIGFASGPGDDQLAECPVRSAPAEAPIPRWQMPILREELLQVAAFAPGLSPYEYGQVTSNAAWSDREPGTRWALPRGRTLPGAYELRWWLPNGDDLVASVFVFPGEADALDFLRLASSAECREDGVEGGVTNLPPGGHNLQWRNPAGVTQQDLYLQRGKRVYRVVVVKAGAGSEADPEAAREQAFALVNGLACVLPGAGCEPAEEAGDAVSS